ncbi:MAG: pcaR1 [Aeromicrobium sp.]|nr:pcaR1 [Ilumatobacteraceae bacterium]MCW2801337.1 pcaR1 [Aeromicrobium sp.]
MEKEPRKTHFVQSLERGFAVIKAFGAETPSLTLSEVARDTGLTRAAARRFLLTLVDLGYARSDGRLFSLTPRVLELGYKFLSGLPITEVAAPHLEHLTSQVHESSSVSVLDGDEVVYVARIPTSRIMSVSISVGTRFPAYATSMGRVLLAGLDDAELDTLLETMEFSHLTPRTVANEKQLRADLTTVRKQGWSIVDQELEVGLRSVAVPIRDHTSKVVAAANVSTHSSRASVAEIRRNLLPPLRAAVDSIERDLRSAH